MHILYAEDDDFLRPEMTLWLERLGHTIVTVTNGADLRAELVRQRFDALLTDDRMPPQEGMPPESTGTTVLREIKGKPEFAHMRLVLTSGTADYDTATQLGARFLPKPCRRQEIVDALADGP